MLPGADLVSTVGEVYTHEVRLWPGGDIDGVKRFQPIFIDQGPERVALVGWGVVQIEPVDRPGRPEGGLQRTGHTLQHLGAEVAGGGGAVPGPGGNAESIAGV